MANTGAILVIRTGDDLQDLRAVEQAITRRVEASPFLKNLVWNRINRYTLYGICDSITADDAARWINEEAIPEGCRVFIINSVYEDNWEEVLV